MKVTAIHKDGKAADTFGPQTSGYLNFLAGGFISGNDGQLGICNMFDFDSLKFDAQKRRTDLEKLGRLSYEGWNGIVSKEFFMNNHFDEF